ncbi:MAG: hypothetical protein E7K53_05735 [Streptococcus parasanguinis]|jgi:hypothetical protein|uniref:Uncharacterized protein n=1 Tax=Siphoviridae sp. ctC4e1 TaxID=2825375 RepID=A0A8S5VI08_9CAUD|nr:hypothetical protein [Streptococcus parasanguinis]DAG06326.1 MAG TPA: Protein of unknown function (DUF1043) [Siphoviridae sp. ctC4e1]
MYNEILGCMTIAGTFFAAGFAGAVWDFKRAQRKKARLAKQEAIMQQYEEDLQEKFNEGYRASFIDLAEARKHSYSDNDWGMQEV